MDSNMEGKSSSETKRQFLVRSAFAGVAGQGRPITLLQAFGEPEALKRNYNVQPQSRTK
jgi:hypothetical protein